MAWPKVFVVRKTYLVKNPIPIKDRLSTACPLFGIFWLAEALIRSSSEENQLPTLLLNQRSSFRQKAAPFNLMNWQRSTETRYGPPV